MALSPEQSTMNKGQRANETNPSERNNKAPLQSFKDLLIWQKSMDIASDVHKLSKLFPREELYGLTAQIRKSAISVPSNIAEGFKRWHKAEFKQFLHISLGSLGELETQALLAASFGYVAEEQKNKLLEKISACEKMISKLAAKYQR